MTALFFLGEVTILIGMLSAVFCLFIPKGLGFYHQWQSTKKPRDFSLFFNCFVWAFLFASFVYTVVIQASLKVESYFSSGVEKLVITLLLTVLSVYLLVPKMLYFFQKWRISKKRQDFCFSILLALIEFYCISYIYLLYVPGHYD